MFESTWLHRLSRRTLGRGRRASVQVGLHRSATHWVAARVRLDPGAGPSVEQFETVAVGSPREQEAIRQLGRTGILRNAPVVLVLGAEQYNTFPLPAPSVPDTELREALRWQLRAVLPYGPEDAIISDELNHASIIDGARLSRAKIKVFRHKDALHAEELLKEVAGEPGHKLIITDGVFSMDGDIGPLPALCDLAEKYGAIMMIDDAHSSGVLGRNGRGTVDHYKVYGRVDVQVGTLSKAIGALGGYVCGSKDLIDFLYHRARPFLFSTSHPPSVAATCIAAFDVLEKEPELMDKLWANTRFFKKELGLLGFNIGGSITPASETPITPIIIGDGRLTMEFSRELFNEGVLTPGIAFPTVAEGKARLRTIMTATHTQDQLTKALEVLKKVGTRMGIIK